MATVKKDIRSNHLKRGPVPKPLEPKSYLGPRSGNVRVGGRAWHQQRLEQLLKHPDKNANVLRAMGICFLRYMQYDADLKGLDGDVIYPD